MSPSDPEDRYPHLFRNGGVPTNLAKRIQAEKRSIFSLGEKEIDDGLDKRDLGKMLTGIMREAVFLSGEGGFIPGNPPLDVAAGKNINPHLEKTRERVPQLRKLFQKAAGHHRKAQEAFQAGDFPRAACHAVGACRTVERMKLIHVEAAELEGIQTAIGRDKRRWPELGDREDFECRCQHIWKDRKDASITGADGVVPAAIGLPVPTWWERRWAPVGHPDPKTKKYRQFTGPSGKVYPRRTLEDWARELKHKPV